MANKIITKNSSTAGAVPTAVDLVTGELAVNVTDKRLFTENAGGTIVELGTNPSSLTVNEAGADVDFRVESDTNTHALFLEGSSGNVGIGTSSPGSALEVSSASSTGITVRSGSLTDYGFINFTDGAVKGQLLYDHDGDYMRMYVNSAERMRIDSSGNVDVAQAGAFPGAGNTTIGLRLASDGRFFASAAGTSYAANFNVNADGDVVTFRKSGTTVGSIGSYTGAYLYIGSTGGVDTHIGFVNGSVRPATSDGSLLDNTLDLGNAPARWKNLYLSGGVYLGGTGSLNYLDDYEEGTWAPVIADATTGGNTGSATISYANYTKIGRQVTVTANIVNINTTGMTSGNGFIVRGLPFTSSSANVSNGSCLTDSITYPSSRTTLTPQVAVSDAWITFIASSSGLTDATLTVGGVTSGTADIVLTITYFV